MGEEVYKSVYVRAGKREDGTFGLMREGGTLVFGYTTIEEAKRHINKDAPYETTIVDVGAIVDRNLDRTGKRLNISKIVRSGE